MSKEAKGRSDYEKIIGFICLFLKNVLVICNFVNLWLLFMKREAVYLLPW